MLSSAPCQYGIRNARWHEPSFGLRYDELEHFLEYGSTVRQYAERLVEERKTTLEGL